MRRAVWTCCPPPYAGGAHCCLGPPGSVLPALLLLCQLQHVNCCETCGPRVGTSCVLPDTLSKRPCQASRHVCRAACASGLGTVIAVCTTLRSNSYLSVLCKVSEQRRLGDGRPAAERHLRSECLWPAARPWKCHQGAPSGLLLLLQACHCGPLHRLKAAARTVATCCTAAIACPAVAPCSTCSAPALTGDGPCVTLLLPCLLPRRRRSPTAQLACAG
jgi:hypothetical protein